MRILVITVTLLLTACISTPTRVWMQNQTNGAVENCPRSLSAVTPTKVTKGWIAWNAACAGDIPRNYRCGHTRGEGVTLCQETRESWTNRERIEAQQREKLRKQGRQWLAKTLGCAEDEIRFANPAGLSNGQMFYRVTTCQEDYFCTNNPVDLDCSNTFFQDGEQSPDN